MVEMMPQKSPFEINWPLATQKGLLYTLTYYSLLCSFQEFFVIFTQQIQHIQKISFLWGKIKLCTCR